MTKTWILPLLLALSGTAHAGSFSLHVDAGGSRDHIDQQFAYDAGGCHGDNVSPAISWSNAPEDARGFALTVYDPDANGGWWHWVVLDLPLVAHELKQDAQELPPGAYALTNSFGHARWDGPCPPKADGPHHYVFTLYALDAPTLALPQDTSPEQAKAAIVEHAIGKASVTLTYDR